jgi:predicted transcriptional regulator
MGKYKENAKYNVISMRVSDDEKIALEQMAKYTQKSISLIMREAMNQYYPCHENGSNLGQ